MTLTAAQTVRELSNRLRFTVKDAVDTLYESGAGNTADTLNDAFKALSTAAETLLAREEAKEETKPLDRAFLQGAGDAIKAKLPDSYGFILLAFPFNRDGDQRLVYCSNAQRADALNTVKEWLLKCGASEDWMKHIN